MSSSSSSTSSARQVIFFGSVFTNVIGYEVKDPLFVTAAERQGLMLSLRTTAMVPCVRVEEAFGSVAISSPFPLVRKWVGTTTQTYVNAKQSPTFLPVMVELAKDAAADMAPVEAIADITVDDDATGKVAQTPGDDTLEVTFTLEAQQRAGGSAATVATKRLCIQSLNNSVGQDLCTIVRVRVPAKALRLSGAGGGPGDSNTSPIAAARINSKADGAQVEVAEADAAVLVDVMVRVVSLADRVRAAQEAEDVLHEILATPTRSPHMQLTLATKERAPYGSLPLPELYKHYRLYFSQFYSKSLKESSEVSRMLAVATNSGSSPATFPYRTNGLTSLCLNRVLLGDEAFAPILLTLAHCTNLRELTANQNKLGDITCARLCALLSRHRYLHTVSLEHNCIYEGGADQLLRLVRRNHRLAHVDIAGNPCSAAIIARIAQVATANADGIRNDTLNVLSPQYGYLTSPASLPRVSLKQALSVWAMLSASAVGDVDVWVRNSTTEAMDNYEDASVVVREKYAAAVASASSLIPAVARAPLLNEIARTVSVGIARVSADPLVRSVFTDVESIKEQQRKRKEERAVEAQCLPPTLQAAVDQAQQAQSTVSAVSDEEDIYSTSFLRLVVTTMRGVANDTEWAQVAAVIQGIGRRQRAMGVMPEDYWLATHVFMKSVYVSCGTDEMPAESIAAFLMTLALGIRTAVGEDMI